MAKTQFVFQGGGAKLTALAAAVEALQACKEQGVTEVTRVSGTSAGSIAAALVAFDIRVNEIDSSMLEPALALLRASEEVRGLKKTGWLANGEKLLQVYRGRALVPENLLRDFIAALLDGLGVAKETRVCDAKIPLFISAASLSEEQAVYFSSEDNSGDILLLDALYASCNIPLLFSSFENVKDWRSACVDGGLCENLPVEILASGADQFGQVMAVSLRSSEKSWPPDNAKDFLLHLFDISINNSVERAKRAIGADNILSVNSTVSSLDFLDIPSTFRLSDSYRDTRNRCLSWMKARFDALAQAEESSKREIPSAPTQNQLLAQNWKSLLYRLQDKSFKVTYSAMIAKPRCWGRGLSDGSDSPDSLIRAHLIPRQDDFRLQEYPIGISSLDGQWSTPPLLQVKQKSKNGSFTDVNYEIATFLKESTVFGEHRQIYQWVLTLEKPLREAGDDIGDEEADALFVWYEQTAPCLFKDLPDPNEEYDTLGLQLGGSVTGCLENVYLMICGNPMEAGVSVQKDPKSVELRPFHKFEYLPTELAILCDHDKPLHGWHASGIGSGQGARLRLTN